jgi:hypothetical protein
VSRETEVGGDAGIDVPASAIGFRWKAHEYERNRVNTRVERSEGRLPPTSLGGLLAVVRNTKERLHTGSNSGKKGTHAVSLAILATRCGYSCIPGLYVLARGTVRGAPTGRYNITCLASFLLTVTPNGGELKINITRRLSAVIEKVLTSGVRRGEMAYPIVVPAVRTEERGDKKHHCTHFGRCVPSNCTALSHPCA